MKIFELLSMAGWVLGCSYTRFKHRELEREFIRKAKDDMEIECIKDPGKIFLYPNFRYMRLDIGVEQPIMNLHTLK